MPSAGDFMPISAGVLPRAAAAGRVMSVSINPGVQAFTMRLGWLRARCKVYALVHALEIP